jgi:uncharacterized protein (DUF2062 family)
MFKLITMLIISWAVLSGGISCAQVASATAPAMDVYDGFETTSLSKVWDDVSAKIVIGWVGRHP